MLSADRYTGERSELRAVRAKTSTAMTPTERSQRRYEKEQDELDYELRWLKEDKHYTMPGGYKATPAVRMEALPWPKFEWATAEQQREAVRIACRRVCN